MVQLHALLPAKRQQIVALRRAMPAIKAEFASQAAALPPVELRAQRTTRATRKLRNACPLAPPGVVLLERSAKMMERVANHRVRQAVVALA